MKRKESAAFVSAAMLAAIGGLDMSLLPLARRSDPQDEEFFKLLDSVGREIWARRFARGLTESEREFVQRRKQEQKGTDHG